MKWFRRVPELISNPNAELQRVQSVVQQNTVDQGNEEWAAFQLEPARGDVSAGQSLRVPKPKEETSVQRAASELSM